MINEIPRVRLPQNYLTNGVPSGEQHLMFWNAALHSRPGRIAEVIVPAVVTIARHLIAQGKKEEAREWLGPLRWSRARGYLEQFGVDVIAELEGDQQPGAATPPDVPVSPAEY